MVDIKDIDVCDECQLYTDGLVRIGKRRLCVRCVRDYYGKE